MATESRFERDFLRAALLQGRSAVGLGDLPRGYERLHYVLVRARAANVIDFELPVLVAIAELEIKQGRPAIAMARLEEAWEGIRRGPFSLVQADAYNMLAEVQLAMGDKRAAAEAAIQAFKVAWCDGPPFAYSYGLQCAKTHLERLAAPEPDMPRYDDAKFEPRPTVEINPEDQYWVDPDNLVWDKI